VAYVGGFASKYIGGISIEDGLWHAVAVDDDWWVVPHNPQRTDDGMATTLCGIESRWLATAAEPPPGWSATMRKVVLQGQAQVICLCPKCKPQEANGQPPTC